MPTLTYVGAFRPDYPRNRILRAGLQAHGWTVEEVPLPVHLNTLRKIPGLWRSMWQARWCDAFVLAEFNQLLGPFAILFGWLLRRPVIMDYLVGLYEASVIDRETVAPGSPQAALYRAVDWLNCRFAPAIFTDTQAHRAALRRVIGPAADRLGVVPVGADTDQWQPRPDSLPSPARLTVHFFGTYIPFHGIEVILQAAQLLRDDPGLRFELVGRGQTYPAMRAEAERLALPNVEFVEMLPPEALPDRVAQADICLGVFGKREKTDYVVPNKLYQYMALGKPVITAESAAVGEFFTPGEHLLTIPPGDAAALAAAIRRLADTPAERDRLGDAACRLIHARFTPAQVAAEMVNSFPIAR